MVRPDTYLEVRAHLDALDDGQLEQRFWELSDEVVAPLIDLARTHTSPAIERSVLMRMGIDSLASQAVVAECVTRGLLAHGAGHVVLVLMREWECTAPEAASRLADGEGWDVAEAQWGGAS